MYINKTPVGASATETDPKKEAAAAAEAARIAEFHRQRSSRNPTVIKDSSSYVSNVGMTEGRGEGTIASYGDLNDANLSEEAKANILKSPFGREYLSGEGTLLEQYSIYTDKVNSYINNNPEEAVQRARDMAETNPNFKTKLKNNDGTWKTDEEILKTTRDMMTDGKIGDFHGKLLSTAKASPIVNYYNPTTHLNQANYRLPDLPSYAISVGNRAIGKASLGNWFNFAKERGFDRADLTGDSPELRQLLNDFMDTDRDSEGNLAYQQTSQGPVGGSLSLTKGKDMAGYYNFFGNEAKEHMTWSKDRQNELNTRNSAVRSLSSELDHLLYKKSSSSYHNDEDYRKELDAQIQAKRDKIAAAPAENQAWKDALEGDWWGKNH